MAREKSKIIRTGKKIQDSGLVAGTWGNVSIRLEEDANKFAITPSGMDYPDIEEENIAIVNLEGKKIEGDSEPSTETPMHRHIYNERDDVNAIVHTHSTFASVLACNHKDIPPIIEDMVQIVGGEVETADYALPGSGKLAESAMEGLKDKKAVLLANHGPVSVGSDIDEAMMVAEIVEKSAKIYVFSKILGDPVELSDEDVSKMQDMF